MIDRAALRARLVEMREELLDHLADQVEGGYLARLSEVSGAIAAIDTEALQGALVRVVAEGHDDAADAVPPHRGPALRAVVVDDGKTIMLTSYRGAERLAVVEIDPLRALSLADDLSTAARRRL